MQYCNFSLIGPLYDAADGVNNQLCNKYCDIAMKEMGNINIVCMSSSPLMTELIASSQYDIYEDVCLSNEGLSVCWSHLTV